MSARRPSRREFVRLVVSGAPAVWLAACAHAGRQASGSGAEDASMPNGWQLVPGILDRIRPPVFPDRAFDVTRYGAAADGITDCTEAFTRAISACHDAGGGRVVAAGGVFLTGPIHLERRVNLHVARGATIRFSADPAKYLPPVFTRFEGTELLNYSPLIYAWEADDIAVSGEGTLDGQAGPTAWWPWKGSADFGWSPGAPNYNAARGRLLAMAEQGVAVERRAFGAGDYLRPSFIQPYRCRNVLIEGVTIKRSPMWEIHPVLCTNVTVRGVTIDTHGPNNDGCNPESCRDVLIEGCQFDTGDDCIAIKSGRNADGRRLAVPSENIVIRECRMRDGHGGVTIGSEISGGARHIFAERCEMDSPHLDRVLRLKNNAMRGGTIEHVFMREITVGQVADAVLSIDFYYEEGVNGPYTPVARDIELRGVRSAKSQYGLYLRGFPTAPITDIRVLDSTFANVAKPNVLEHVTGLALRGLTINGVAP